MFAEELEGGVAARRRLDWRALRRLAQLLDDRLARCLLGGFIARSSSLASPNVYIARASALMAMGETDGRVRCQSSCGFQATAYLARHARPTSAAGKVGQHSVSDIPSAENDSGDRGCESSLNSELWRPCRLEQCRHQSLTYKVMCCRQRLVCARIMHRMYAQPEAPR